MGMFFENRILIRPWECSTEDDFNMTSKVEVETVEQLIRKAFQESKSPNRIALARQAVHAIHLNRAGDIFGVWKRLVLIAKIERDSDDLATWAEVIEAVGAMVFLINRSFHE